jgi:serine/threonine protein kinase
VSGTTARRRADRVEALCHEALEREPAERAAFLADACDGDEALRQEVESLVAGDERARYFIEMPALEILARQRSDPEDLPRVGRVVPGTRFGAYEVMSIVGSGGMGDVYRARDTSLDREVALKVLPEHFATDPERLARFEREARLLASLNHPNIAVIHGIEEANGVRALILELVDGQTLAELVARGPVPLDEAIRLICQVAEGLEASHGHGIVHRDLKPANVKVRPDGVVKVLDFGLAKVIEGGLHVPRPLSPDASDSQSGILLGTAAYMSPEQIKGATVDRRADVWAFGCLLFEMLTGHAAFRGDTAGEILARVLRDEPDWAAVANTPPDVQRVLRRCLQKDPRARLRDLGDARLELQSVHTSEIPLPYPPPRERHGVRTLATLALLAVTVVLAGLWASSPETPPPMPLIRLPINTPPTTQPASLALSPDGSTVVSVVTVDGRQVLWLWPLSGTRGPEPLAGTEHASYPFWSSDSQSIGFFGNGQLKTLDVTTGDVRTLTAAAPVGGAWAEDGTIIFSRGLGGPLFAIRPESDDVRPVTMVHEGAASHLHPHVLPDGRRFLFVSTGTEPGIYAADLGDPGFQPRLVEAAEAAQYVRSGHLLFIRGSTLFARRFDADALVLSGPEVTVAGSVLAVSSSATGPIIYRTGTASSRFEWFDRSGKPLGMVPGSEVSDGFHAALSRDERFLAMAVRRGGTTDMWILDMQRGKAERQTFDEGWEGGAVWSPTGRYLAFIWRKQQVFDVYVKPTTGPGNERLIVEAGDVTDWSTDERLLVFTSTQRDIFAVPVDGTSEPFHVADSQFAESNGQLSPDGEWLAYQSDESTTLEIWVQRFPRGPRFRISSGGGVQARWRRDGRELYYLGADGTLMAVPIRLDAARQQVDFDTAERLFAPTWGALAPWQSNARNYMVSEDGHRFLVLVQQDVSLPITVMLGWRFPAR